MADGGDWTSPAQEIVFLPASDKLGALIGTPAIVPDAINNHLSGTLSWNGNAAPPPPGAVPAGTGFGPTELTLLGGKDAAPAAGTVVMDLPNVNSSAMLSFLEGGLLPGQPRPLTFSIRNTSASGNTQTVTLPKAGGAANVAEVGLGFASSPLGLVSVGLTIGSTVTYLGTIIRPGSAHQARGSFLLPQLPQPGQTQETSLELSRQVLLEGTGQSMGRTSRMTMRCEYSLI